MLSLPDVIWGNIIEERVTNKRQGATAFVTCSDVHSIFHLHWTEFIICTQVNLGSLEHIIGMSVICLTRICITV